MVDLVILNIGRRCCAGRDSTMNGNYYALYT